MSHFALPRLLALLLLGGAAFPVPAVPRVDVAVVDRETGQWLAPVGHRGERWIEGTPGHRYGIRLASATGRRVLVVLSVDGINAITGQTASPSQAGYVLDPWQTTQVDGWRKSMEHVAQFVFTDVSGSYAARTSRPDDVGVIGIAVFDEAQASRPPVAIAEHPQRDAAARTAAPSAVEQASAQSIGTGHGGREWSPTWSTSFRRASRVPAQVTQLRYDDRAGLLARGVLPDNRGDDPGYRPRAFPGGFVPDPPGE